MKVLTTTQQNFSVNQRQVHWQPFRWTLSIGLAALFLGSTALSEAGETNPEIPTGFGTVPFEVPVRSLDEAPEIPKASWKLNKIHKKIKRLKKKMSEERPATKRLKRMQKKLRQQQRALNTLQEAMTSSSNELEQETVGRVGVMLEMENKALSEAAKKEIETLGGKIIAHYRRWISVLIPEEVISKVSEIQGVKWMQEPPPVGPVDAFQELNATTSSFSPSQCQHFVTQGVKASLADKWHRAGFTGKGVRVAVLDQFQGSEIVRNCGELPNYSIFELKKGDFDATNSHGTAVAEIIHDMAPQADLTLASPPINDYIKGTDPVAMAEYIAELAKGGHKVISSSIGAVHFGSGDGTGSLDRDMFRTAIEEAEEEGAMFVQAAGNQAEFHWDGIYRDTNGDNIHEFSFDGTIVNGLNRGALIPPNTPLRIYLRWNDWDGTGQDYDLYLVYRSDNRLPWNFADYTFPNGQVMSGRSQNNQMAGYPPMEMISSYVTPQAGYYGIIIVKRAGNGQQTLDLNGFNLPPLTFNVRARSLVDVATPKAAFSVAAVDAGTFQQESYSSEGSLHGPGGLLTGGDRNQPRIAGFANVDTLSSRISTGRPFNGTSAATPHVAGAAALMMSAFPNYTPGQVKKSLENLAIDQGEQGYDMQYGHGRLSLGEPPVPRAPVLITPSGIVADATPTYSWYASPSATWYYLYIEDSTGPKIQGWISAANSGCGSGESQCSVTLATPLALGQGMWTALSWNSAGTGDWSSVESFTIVQ